MLVSPRYHRAQKEVAQDQAVMTKRLSVHGCQEILVVFKTFTQALDEQISCPNLPIKSPGSCAVPENV